MLDTNETLLTKVRDMDAHDAWRLFYDQYWAVILAYARKLGLNEYQAEEVLQETMVTLMRVLPEFSYDRRKGKFRNFLLTIVHRKSLAAFRRAKREANVQIELESTEERDSANPFQSETDAAEAEALWKESVVEEALRRLSKRSDLGESTYAVFEAYVLKRRTAGEVANEFGLKENAVYQIKNRMLRFWRYETAQLMRVESTQDK